MLIRRVQECDLPALVVLCREHAAYEGVAYVDNGHITALSAAFFQDPPRLHGWVVVADDGQIVGYMTATKDFATWTGEHFIHMDCLYLKEQQRGKGVGRSFVEALKAFARDQQCSLIQWQTPADNQNAIEFYRKLGARSKPKLRFFLDC